MSVSKMPPRRSPPPPKDSSEAFKLLDEELEANKLASERSEKAAKKLQKTISGSTLTAVSAPPKEPAPKT